MMPYKGECSRFEDRVSTKEKVKLKNSIPAIVGGTDDDDVSVDNDDNKDGN